MHFNALFFLAVVGLAAAIPAPIAEPEPQGFGLPTRSVGGLPTGIPRPTFSIPSRPSGSSTNLSILLLYKHCLMLY